MKRTIFSLILLLSLQVYAQKVTLEECQQKAQDNYPLAVQYNLIEKAREYNLENASKGYLPQFSLMGKATYQSDVTKLPVQIPNVTIKALSKDQYQAMLELKQNIWDGGEIRSQKKQIKASSDMNREQLKVDMYTLNERVNQIYFSILLLDARLTQNRLLQENLTRSYHQVTAYINNGIANSSDLDAVKVEQLNTRQSETELRISRAAYIQILSLLTGEIMGNNVELEKPSEKVSFETSVNNRPELFLFDAQNESLQATKAALNSRNLPRLGVFVQGAYGNPGLNMLKNEFTPFYIAGVRLTWNFGGLYTLRNDKKIIENNRQILHSNRNTFLFNTHLQATQENSAVQSMRALMHEDNEIIVLRENIRKAAEAKVANGTLTVIEMLRELTAENLARQAKALHEVQLLMNIYQLKHTTNN